MAKFQSLSTNLGVAPVADEQPAEVPYKENFDQKKASNIDDLVQALSMSDLVTVKEVKPVEVTDEKEVVLNALRKLMEYVAK